MLEGTTMGRAWRYPLELTKYTEALNNDFGCFGYATVTWARLWDVKSGHHAEFKVMMTDIGDAEIVTNELIMKVGDYVRGRLEFLGCERSMCSITWLATPELVVCGDDQYQGYARLAVI